MALAAAEDKDPAGPLYRGVGGRETVASHQIAAGQILVGRVDAVQIFTGNAHEPWQACTGADKDGLEDGDVCHSRAGPDRWPR